MISSCFVAVSLFLGWLHFVRRRTKWIGLDESYRYFLDADFYSKSHELGAVSHCDARYALDHALGVDEIHVTLKGLLYGYAERMRQFEVDTWIAHGTLLGWYWNGKMLPWDTDVDVQVTYQGISKLGARHNMSEFEIGGRKYVLDINPHYKMETLADGANHIDGRWIDVSNGKFIDITALHRERPPEGGGVETLFGKDGHRYEVEDIFPLKQSMLEGIQIDVPQKSEKILREEYGAKALSRRKFHW